MRRLEDRYDLTLLNGPEEALTRLTGAEAARTIVSDALLLAFCLARQQRRSPLSHQPPGSRRGTIDEYCLVTLLGASRYGDSELAREAARALGLSSIEVAASLVVDLVRQIERTYLPLDVPTLSEFRIIVADRSIREEAVPPSLSPAGFNFSL
ncbi:hypothetical protein [Microvirga alba]|uniref:hypothetical protein n=1 Tax=Microvirga alba TaxID=2791025 RepID=UPI0018AF9A37|nr:hypothetical protein [Microvirga alba]